MKIHDLKLTTLFLAAALMLGGFALKGPAQTSAFTYQGRFTDSTVAQPTNGTYNMQFALFDAVSGGNQIGVSVVVPAVSVVNGIFTVSLDYTAASFDGSPRFLQVTVGNTVLNPRQTITSAPYAITSKNALQANNSNQLGGIDADQYVTGQVVRSINNLTNNVTLAAGNNITITPSGNTLTIASTGGNSGSGINNQTSLQGGANFNIDGTGAAKIFNATTQFNLGGTRFLSGGGGNIFAGDNAGAGTTGIDNAFVGARAGLTNSTGSNNSFFGTDAGRSNTADGNSFFGRSAGYDNTIGTQNAFFGLDAGRFNQTGGNNSFFGYSAGRANISGVSNSFFGRFAGTGNVDGTDNSFFGRGAGQTNMAGKNNSFFGSDAGRNSTADYNSFFGRSAGFDTTSGDSNSFFGVDAGRYNQTGASNSFFGFSAGKNNLTGTNNSFVGIFAGQTNTTGGNNTALGNRADVAANNLNFATAIGAGAVVSTSNTVVLGRTADTVVVPNLLQVGALGATGTTSLCRNAANQISTCAAGGGTNSGDFIQNQQTSPQSADFSISGSGRVGQFFSAAVVSTETFYRIGTQIIFNTPNATSVAVGQSSGFNATGGGNAFFGTQSGSANTSGEHNSYFGFQAGQSGGTTGGNSFFGYQAGKMNNGSANTFIGGNAGSNSVNGSANTLIGNSSGANGSQNTAVGADSFGNGNLNTVVGSGAGGNGSENAIFGASAGGNGSGNTFIGRGAGGNGDSNTIIGAGARIIPYNTSFTPSNSTAIGAGAVIQFSHQIVLGTQTEEVDIPGSAHISGKVFSNGVNTTDLTVTGGNIKFTTTQFPSDSGNRHLCLNDKSFVAVCPEDAFKTNSSSSNNQPEQAMQIEAQAAQIKAQAALIERQVEQFKQQQTQIEALKQTVCAMNPAAKICGK